MTLVIATYVPEGIVMASDSRQSITLEGKTPDGKDIPKIDTINSDNVYKTFLVSRKKDEKPIFEIGISFFGQDLLGGIPTASHVERFKEEELTDNDDVTTIPQKLVNFFKKLLPTADTGFHIAGYRKEGRNSIPYIFTCHVSKGTIEQKNLKPDKSLEYGAIWSGQPDIINGLINPVIMDDDKGAQKILRVTAPIAWGAMPLQDAIDFSIFSIRTTIDTIRFQARPKNVGGPIDVLVITPDGPRWIQKKELKFI
jgi:hypothetical protein